MFFSKEQTYRLSTAAAHSPRETTTYGGHLDEADTGSRYILGTSIKCQQVLTLTVTRLDTSSDPSLRVAISAASIYLYSITSQPSGLKPDFGR